jgi:hypothetical protein
VKKRLALSLYKSTSYLLAIVFAAVGLIFLFAPDGLIGFFNRISGRLGMTPSPENGLEFFLVLAAAYMYLVTALAWMMGRHAENPIFPLLLVNGKIASSLLSFGFFFISKPYLIFLVNGIVDGLIGGGVLLLYFRTKGIRR